MTTRRGHWRAWLAAATAAGLAGSGTLLVSLAGTVSAPRPGLIGGSPATASSQAPAPGQPLPAGPLVRSATVLDGSARREVHQGARADGLGGQVQLPSAASTLLSKPARPGATARDGLRSWPAWRRLLESWWRERLARLTELSVSYHAAAEHAPVGTRGSDSAGPPQLRRLMQQAVAARRALSDTEEALGRLSAGHFGRCEQCAGLIPSDRLVRAPELRYCAVCM